MTILGLEYLQESSRKNALGSLLEERDGEYQAALADFNTGEFGGICVIFVGSYNWVDYSKCGVCRSKGTFEGTA